MTTSSFPLALRALRHTLDLTVDEIATIGGVAPSYWRRVEDGDASPSVPWIRTTVQRVTAHASH